jgi:hypothetical protein
VCGMVEAVQNGGKLSFYGFTTQGTMRLGRAYLAVRFGAGQGAIFAVLTVFTLAFRLRFVGRPLARLFRVHDLVIHLAEGFNVRRRVVLVVMVAEVAHKQVDRLAWLRLCGLHGSLI